MLSGTMDYLIISATYVMVAATASVVTWIVTDRPETIAGQPYHLNLSCPEPAGYAVWPGSGGKPVATVPIHPQTFVYPSGGLPAIPHD